MKKQEEKIIRAAITTDALASYLVAEYGEMFGVYRDGSIAVGQSVGMEIVDEERPIIAIKCPGLSNIDSWFWTDGWTTWDVDTHEYVTEDGRRLNLEECIVDCCKNGEVDEEREALITSLIESLAEARR